MSEVKRELKSCKTKMETQTKQVQEYSQRLEDYDKKFEESSRKFQNMLTVSYFLFGRRVKDTCATATNEWNEFSGVK